MKKRKISRKQEKIIQNNKIIRKGIKMLDDSFLYKDYITNDYIKDCENDFCFIKIYLKAMFRDNIEEEAFYDLIDKKYEEECKKYSVGCFDLIDIIEVETRNMERNYFYPILIEYEINKLIKRIKNMRLYK